MKSLYKIIGRGILSGVGLVSLFSGCDKKEVPKPTEQSAQVQTSYKTYKVITGQYGIFVDEPQQIVHTAIAVGPGENISDEAQQPDPNTSTLWIQGNIPARQEVPCQSAIQIYNIRHRQPGPHERYLQDWKDF